MTVNCLSDYFEAVEERQRLESLVEVGRRQFSGYGLELFEGGFLGKIQRLTDEIARYEIQSGYRAACDSFRLATWSSSLECKIVGGLIIGVGSFANLSNCNVGVRTFDVQMGFGPLDQHLGMHLKASPVQASDESSFCVTPPTEALIPI